MLFFITPQGLVSEDTIANRKGPILRPLHPFVEIPLMKELSKCDLLMGNYDLKDDKKYYQPAVVDNVVVRNITKIIDRKAPSGPYTYYMFCLEWFSIHNKIHGIRTFTINDKHFQLQELFSRIIPFINRCIELNDTNLAHHILMITRLMGISGGFYALFDPKVTSNHASYSIVRKDSIDSEYDFMEVSCRYTYQYRVGRDDYEYETMTVIYNTPQNDWFAYSIKTDRSYLQDLLYDTISRKYQSYIDVKKNGNEYTYIFESWSDKNYGPSKQDFNYSKAECQKMKEILISEINATYKQYYDDFVEAYKAFLDNENK